MRRNASARLVCFRAAIIVLASGMGGGACPARAQTVDQQATPAVETADRSETKAPKFATEVWLTPLILLPGVALLIASTSARFGQLHIEFHRLLDHPDRHAQIVARHLLKRSALFRDALVALYGSVGLFAFGSLLGGVVNLWQPESLWFVGGATIIGIGCIVFAAVQLVREALTCLQVMVDHAERLKQEDTS